VLPSNIESLLRGQIDIDLQLQGFRPPSTSSRTISQRVLNRSINAGGLQPAKFAVNVSNEISLVQNTITEAMKKVLSKVQVAPYDALADDLLHLYDEEFTACLNTIRDFAVREEQHEQSQQQLDRVRIPPQWFDEKANLARGVGEMEIKVLAAELEERASRRNAVTMTITNSQVGIVQTGDQASVVSSTVSLTTEQKQELNVALQELCEKLDTVESMSPTTRGELREIALEVESELAKPKPNHARIKGLLTMVLAGIKGIGSLATVSEAILSVLKLLGIHLG
jgi:hypothetical protein